MNTTPNARHQHAEEGFVEIPYSLLTPEMPKLESPRLLATEPSKVINPWVKTSSQKVRSPIAGVKRCRSPDLTAVKFSHYSEFKPRVPVQGQQTSNAVAWSTPGRSHSSGVIQGLKEAMLLVLNG